MGREPYCSRACASIGNNNWGDKRNTDASYLDPANQLDEFSDFRYYERKARARSKNRPNCRDSSLTLPQIKEQWDRQKGLCRYSGIPLVLMTADRVKSKLPQATWASLDRIDSRKPYEAGNIQFISRLLNYAKSDLSDAEFIEALHTLGFKARPLSNDHHTG